MSSETKSGRTRDASARGSESFLVGGGETGALIRSIDWSSTPLGTERDWPQSLRTAIDVCVNARFPMALYWGPELMMLYNDELLPMVGADEHPRAMGQPAFTVLTEIRPIVEPLLVRVRHTGETIRAEDLMLPFVRGEGRTASFFTFTASPIRDESGAVGGVLCAVLEATAGRQLAMSERAREEAQRAEQAQSALLEFQERFVAVLGHDLRNPLSSISMAAGLLAQMARDSGDLSTTRIVGRMTSSARRMANMIDQIMDLSRSRLGGGFEVKPKFIELRTVLSSVVDELRSVHPDARVEIRGVSVVGKWDRGSLEQVFSNLIGNAIHHGLASTRITVEVAHLHRTDDVRVCVHNEGTAIPEATRATLFDAFRRGERSSRDANTRGLGLGLYISRELVVAHGGDISVESDAASGTTFCVLLPRVSRPSGSRGVEP